MSTPRQGLLPLPREPLSTTGCRTIPAGIPPGGAFLALRSASRRIMRWHLYRARQRHDNGIQRNLRRVAKTQQLTVRGVAIPSNNETPKSIYGAV